MSKYSYSEGFWVPISNYPSTSYSAQDVAVAYDSYGRRATMTDATGSKSYSYDDLDKLTSVSTTYTGLAAKSVSYTYNSDGSRSGMTAAGESFAYSYDGDGRMTSETDPFSQASSWSYLDNGWLSAYGSALTAGYDGDGLRAWKSDGTTTTYFLYDGASPVCELQYDSGTSTTNVTATNVFGAHGLLSRTASSGGTNTPTFYTFDPQGSVAQRLSSSGAVGATDCYNAWGTRSSTSSAAICFGYGAQWGYCTDAETGLILCTHRCYDPAAGRWLTRDPIGYDGGVNLYGYCGNEPVGAADASGNSPYSQCCTSCFDRAFSLAMPGGGIIGGACTGAKAIRDAIEASAVRGAALSVLVGIAAGMGLAFATYFTVCYLVNCLIMTNPTHPCGDHPCG